MVNMLIIQNNALLSTKDFEIEIDIKKKKKKKLHLLRNSVILKKVWLYYPTPKCCFAYSMYFKTVFIHLKM
jgi:hypothetical protein